MPEYREVLASVITINRWFRGVQELGELSKSAPGTSRLALQAIWVDATSKEQTVAKKGTPAKAGMAYTLSPDQRCLRGSKGSQKDVYPPSPWSHRPGLECAALKNSRERGKEKPLSPLTTMWLQNVHATPRTVVLDLGIQFLQVCVS